MGRTFEATSGTITEMWRRDANGKLFQLVPDREEYVVPPKGTRGRFKISGISDEFMMRGYDNPDIKVPTVRVEFEIVKATGNWGKVSSGKRFTELFPLKLSNRSKLGQLIGALRGREIDEGENIDIDAYIGASFVTTTKLSEGGNPKIGIDTIEDGSADVPFLAPVKGAGSGDEDLDDDIPEALQPIGAVAGKDDPFGLDDDL